MQSELDKHAIEIPCLCNSDCISMCFLYLIKKYRKGEVCTDVRRGFSDFKRNDFLGGKVKRKFKRIFTVAANCKSVEVHMRQSLILYPSPSLSRYIKYYWVLKSDEIEPLRIQTIPSGCLHLVFHRGDGLNLQSGSGQPKNFLRGQFSTYGSLLSQGNIDMIAVIFHPVGWHPFGHCSMKDLYNNYLPLENLEDKALNRLRSSVGSEEKGEVCVQLIERFLENRLTQVDYPYKRIENAVGQMVHSPQLDVGTLAENACWGYRQFKRVFTEFVGIGPKEYSKVIRFQRVLYLLQTHPKMEIADAAYACGFYDPSHLVKDFRLFSGCSPARYLSCHRPYSTFFSKGCQLNTISSLPTLRR